MKEKCQWNQLGFSGYWSCFLDFLHKTAAWNLKTAGEFIVTHNTTIYLFLLGAGKKHFPFCHRCLLCNCMKGTANFHGAVLLCASENVD